MARPAVFKISRSLSASPTAIVRSRGIWSFWQSCFNPVAFERPLAVHSMLVISEYVKVKSISEI